MSTSKQPYGSRAFRIAAGLGALVVAFGVPATASAQYPLEPPAGEVLPPAGESGSTPPAGEVAGAGGAVQAAAALPQTGSELDGTLALGAGALIAGLGLSALAWRRRPLTA